MWELLVTASRGRRQEVRQQNCSYPPLALKSINVLNAASLEMA